LLKQALDLGTQASAVAVKQTTRGGVPGTGDAEAGRGATLNPKPCFPVLGLVLGLPGPQRIGISLELAFIPPNFYVQE